MKIIPTADQILEKHCPVFGALFLDKTNKAQVQMYTSIIAAMDEYSTLQKEELRTRLKSEYERGYNDGKNDL